MVASFLFVTFVREESSSHLEGAVEEHGSVFGFPVEKQVDPVPLVILVLQLGVIEQVDFDEVVVAHSVKDRRLVSACGSFVLLENRNSWALKPSLIYESSVIWECYLFLTYIDIE